MPWITPDGEYYDAGDFVHPDSVYVPVRPNNLYSYVNNEWVLDLAKKREAEVPKVVTMRQARLALLNAGKLSTVNATIAAMPGVEGDAARIEWEFSSEVHRNRPLVMSLAPVLGMTESELDQLFTLASTL